MTDLAAGGPSQTATAGASKRRLSREELTSWRAFLRAHAVITRALEIELVADQALSLAAYDVLVQLVEAPDHRLRMTELADAVLLSRSGVTRLVDRLERDGLVERRACDSDARGAFAVITDAGRARLETARRTHVSDVRERFLSRFDADDQAQLAAFWDRLDS